MFYRALRMGSAAGGAATGPGAARLGGAMGSLKVGCRMWKPVLKATGFSTEIKV